MTRVKQDLLLKMIKIKKSKGALKTQWNISEKKHYEASIADMQNKPHNF